MEQLKKPWETLHDLIEGNLSEELLAFLEKLDGAATARAFSRLSQDDQKSLLNLLAPSDAADVIEDINDTQAAKVIEELHPARAASILEELDSDHRVDVLSEVKGNVAEAIIRQMDRKDAEDVRQLLEYPAFSAGGLMISEFLSYGADRTLRDVVADLHAHQEQYGKYNVQYIYVTDLGRKLLGVLRMRDLLFTPKDKSLQEVMIKEPLSVNVEANLTQLRTFFDEHKLFGVPVVDSDRRLLGIVLPEAVREADRKQAAHQFLRLSGIIGGEEFRSMPLLERSGRRLSWLTLNIVLNIIAASVIAMYQDTLASVIALAVFLPMVSDMSGCSGNQAVAVSMRELSLGLIRTRDFFHVLFKEANIGMVNGLALGTVLGSLAYLWKGNIYLSLVVGGALAANTFLSVILGGVLPLALKKVKMDPALVSSPILTTVTDMCGFFFILSLATLLLPRLV